MKIKGNDIVSGIMWGIVIHVGITVLLPRLKGIDLQNIFSQFNVNAQTQTNTTTTTTTEDQDENEPPPDEEEDEEGITPAPGPGDSEDDEDMEEEVPSDEEQIEMGEEMGYDDVGGAAARSPRGRRRGRGIGEDNIMAEYANRIRV